MEAIITFVKKLSLMEVDISSNEEGVRFYVENQDESASILLSNEEVEHLLIFLSNR